MEQKAYMLAAAMVLTAVLVLLLNPATPGVIAPTGTKTLLSLFLLVLSVFTPLSLGVMLLRILAIVHERTARISPHPSLISAALRC